MNKIFSLFCIVLFLFFSCKQISNPENKNISLAKNNSAAVMDTLENFFNNDNWMKIIQEDTSYYNFSRNQAVMKVYNYNIIKGDSVNTVMSSIRIVNDSLQWQFNDTILLALASVDETKAEWKRISNSKEQSSYMLMEKQSDNKIHVTSSHQKEYFFNKTIALGSFLIRSRYDFLHGTKLAFSDTNFLHKK